MVDTGSHDQSREIARHFGARVFDLRWEDDFSKARNFALEQATSDYVLMLDADEYLFASNLIDFHVMKRLLPVKSPRAFAVAIGHFKVETDWINVLTGGGNFITESRAIRIIPRLSGVQHQGTVEESVVDSLSKLNIPVTTLPEDQMRIHHDVLDRERRILRKMRAYDRETDPNLVQLVAAVRDFSYAGDRDGTVRWLKRLVDAGIKEALPLIGRMGIRLVRLIEDESPGEAGQILEDLRTLFPEDRKFTLALSSHFIRNGYFADLSTLDFGQITEAGLRIPNEDLEYWIHGGIAALEGGNINDAACILDHVLSQHSDNLLGQVARFYFFSRIGHLEDATSTLEDLLDITIGRYTTQIMTPTEFLNIVEQLSDTLGRWGHAVERSLLLYGSLALKEKLEVNT